MYLISIYFDEKTNKILNNHIRKIALKTGNTFMIDNNVPPHITISSIEAKSVDVLRDAFDDMAVSIKKGKLQIVSVGQLLPYVMYAAPVLNQYLNDLAEHVYEAFCGINDTTISKYYKPMSWMPHITLGKTLTKEQMRVAFEVLQESFVPLEAEVIKIGLADTNPHRDVVIYELEQSN